MQKKQSKWLIATVVLTLVLSLMQPITYAAAVPFVISASTLPEKIYEGQTIEITLTTSYAYNLIWTASTTVGSVSLNPTRTIKGNHLTVATFTSSAPGTGQITVRATNEQSRKIHATLIVPVVVLASEPEPTDLAPVNVEAPIITPEKPTPTTVVTVTPGVWTDDKPDPLNYSYQWFVNGLAISEATTTNYVVTLNDQGKALTVIVTATDGAGNRTSIQSNAVIVTDITAPINVVAPNLSGTLYSGEPLTVSTGTWTDHTALTFSYQWFKKDLLIENATTNTYTDTNLGDEINAIVTVVDANGNSFAVPSNTVIIIPKPTPVIMDYVSLGDSIAVGYTALNGSTYSFGDQFYNKNIAVQYPGSSYNDLSQNGLDSKELYEKMDGDGDDSVYINAIKNAEIITVCIGANDILDTATNSFQTVNFSAALIGIQDFAIYWPKIIDRINELNSGARILAVELFNPYMVTKPSGYSGDPNFEVIDKYVNSNDDLTANGINETMWSYKTAGTYEMVSVHDAFKTIGTKTLTHFYPSKYLKFIRDPHPNQAGQNLIYNQLILAY